MDKKYSKKGLVLVAPECQNTDTEALKEFIKEKKIKYTVTVPPNTTGEFVPADGEPRILQPGTYSF